jgi:hypothetical protein
VTPVRMDRYRHESRGVELPRHPETIPKSLALIESASVHSLSLLSGHFRLGTSDQR